MYTLSCKYLVLTPDTILPLQLQPDTSSSCNWYTHRVVNTECFRLILYYPFRCNQTVVRVAIDIHSELQILSASFWYYTTPSVAIRQWFELQSMYTPNCKYLELPPDTATGQWFELQLIYTPSYKYWALPPDTILPLQLQPDSGSNCNLKRCWVAIRLTKL
jgi:hypothetical protein